MCKIMCTLYVQYRGCGGVVVSTLKVGGSTPSPCHCVVSLDTPRCMNGYWQHTARE